MEKRTTPVTDRSAWKGIELQNREDEWAYCFNGNDIDELERACASVRHLPLAQINRSNFRIPGLAPVLAPQTLEIESGRGFALLRGLPVERWGLEQSRLAYCGISIHLGLPITQSPLGELLCPVTDRGFVLADPNYRANRGGSGIDFHSDFADIGGLLYIRPAKQGGASRLCSSMSVFNEILNTKPHLLDLLYRGFYFYRKKEEAVGELPVSPSPLPMLSWHADELSFLFWPHFAQAAAKVRGVPLTAAEQEALDTVNALTRRADIVLDTHFQPGDIQYLNNHKILHSRTDYEDWPDQARRRYLERIWLYSRPERTFVPDFVDLHGPKSPIQGIASVLREVLAARGHTVSGSHRVGDHCVR